MESRNKQKCITMPDLENNDNEIGSRKWGLFEKDGNWFTVKIKVLHSYDGLIYD